jgi:hypothetical protein
MIKNSTNDFSTIWFMKFVLFTFHRENFQLFWVSYTITLQLSSLIAAGAGKCHWDSYSIPHPIKSHRQHWVGFFVTTVGVTEASRGYWQSQRTLYMFDSNTHFVNLILILGYVNKTPLMILLYLITLFMYPSKSHFLKGKIVVGKTCTYVLGSDATVFGKNNETLSTFLKFFLYQHFLLCFPRHCGICLIPD